MDLIVIISDYYQGFDSRRIFHLFQKMENRLLIGLIFLWLESGLLFFYLFIESTSFSLSDNAITPCVISAVQRPQYQSICRYSISTVYINNKLFVSGYFFFRSRSRIDRRYRYIDKFKVPQSLIHFFFNLSTELDWISGRAPFCTDNLLKYRGVIVEIKGVPDANEKQKNWNLDSSTRDFSSTKLLKERTCFWFFIPFYRLLADYNEKITTRTSRDVAGNLSG